MDRQGYFFLLDFLVKVTYNNNMNVDVFWNNVKYLCKQKNLTQQELSVNLGLNPRYIANQITNKAVPDVDTVYTLCYFFNVSVSEILKGTTDTDKADILSTDEANKKLKEIQAVLLR